MADLAGAKKKEATRRESRAKKKKTQTTMMTYEKEKILTEPKTLKKTILLGKSPELLQDGIHDPAKTRKL